MLIKKATDIRSSEITDRKLYLNRREFLRTAAVATAGAGIVASGADVAAAGQPAPHGRKLESIRKSPLSVPPGTQDKVNSWEQITSYNNYYEFGTDKDSPSMTAGQLKTEPWSIAVEGECAKKGSVPLEELIK